MGYVGSKSTGILANELRNINQIPMAALQLGDVLGQNVSSQAQIPAAAVALGARYPFGNTGQSVPIQQTLQPFPQVPYWRSILSADTPLSFTLQCASDSTE